MKIFLSPSNQTSNIGLYSRYDMNECLACEQIAAATKTHLLDYDVEVIVYAQEMTMNERINNTNDLCSPTDLHLCIHTNASSNASAKGTETMYNSNNGKSKELAKLLLNNVSEVFGTKRRAYAYDSLSELKNVNCIPCYLECGFHTNIEDTNVIVNYYDEVATAIAASLVEFFSLQYKQPEPEPTPEPTGYVLQIGAYTVENNAINLSTQLLKAGFSVYWLNENNMVKVCVSYTDIEETTAALKQKGFNVWIR